MPPWTGLAIVLSLLMGGWAVRRRVVARQRGALAEVAARLGLEYQVWGEHVHEKYERFHPLGLGRGRVSGDLIRGRRGAVKWEVFDYRFLAEKEKAAYRYAVAAATVDAWFERTTVRPEGLAD